MAEKNPGNKGIGHTGETRYPAENAPVTKNGGNTPIQDHIESKVPKSSMDKK